MTALDPASRRDALAAARPSAGDPPGKQGDRRQSAAAYAPPP